MESATYPCSSRPHLWHTRSNFSNGVMNLDPVWLTKASTVVSNFSPKTPCNPCSAFLKQYLGFGMMAYQTAESSFFPAFPAMFAHPELGHNHLTHQNLILRATDLWYYVIYRKPRAASR